MTARERESADKMRALVVAALAVAGMVITARPSGCSSRTGRPEVLRGGM